MQIKEILFIFLVGAVAVLAKKGGSSEEDRNVAVPVYPNVDNQPMFVVSGPKEKRKPNHYPQGRPFQVQQQMDVQYPQMSSFYPERPGMQQTSFGPRPGQRPFGQNSHSGFPQQYPGSFNKNPSNYHTMGPSGSSRPFYAGSGRPDQLSAGGRPNNFYGRPNQFPGNSQFSGSSQFPGNKPFPGESQFSVNSQFPGNPQFSGSSQFTGNKPFPGNSQLSGSSQFSGSKPFPGNSQFSGSSQFPGNSQLSANTQFPGGRPFPGNGQFSGNSRFPGGNQGPQFSAISKIPNGGQPSFTAQFPGSTFPITSSAS